MSQQYPPGNSNQSWNNFQPPSAYPHLQPTQPQSVPQKKQKKQQPTFKELWNSGPSGKCGILAVVLIVLLALGTCSGIVNAVVRGSQSAAAPTQTAQRASTEPSPAPTATPKPTPTLVPTPTPVPTTLPTPLPIPTQPPLLPTQPPAPPSPPIPTGVNGNPWGYNFTPGNTITNPPADFCTYFTCIASFWNGNGYVDECNDTAYSKSGGLSGACSRHGGEMRPLYSH